MALGNLWSIKLKKKKKKAWCLLISFFANILSKKKKVEAIDTIKISISYAKWLGSTNACPNKNIEHFGHFSLFNLS